MHVAGFSVPFLAVLIVGLLLIWLVFRIVGGALRLVFTLAIIAVLAYLALNVLR